MNTKFIENLFFEQFKKLTLETSQSYDFQFSGDWVNNMRAGGQSIW